MDRERTNPLSHFPSFDPQLCGSITTTADQRQGLGDFNRVHRQHPQQQLSSAKSGSSIGPVGSFHRPKLDFAKAVSQGRSTPTSSFHRTGSFTVSEPPRSSTFLAAHSFGGSSSPSPCFSPVLVEERQQQQRRQSQPGTSATSEILFGDSSSRQSGKDSIFRRIGTSSGNELGTLSHSSDGTKETKPQQQGQHIRPPQAPPPRPHGPKTVPETNLTARAASGQTLKQQQHHHPANNGTKQPMIVLSNGVIPSQQLVADLERGSKDNRVPACRSAMAHHQRNHGKSSCASAPPMAESEESESSISSHGTTTEEEVSEDEAFAGEEECVRNGGEAEADSSLVSIPCRNLTKAFEEMYQDDGEEEEKPEERQVGPEGENVGEEGSACTPSAKGDEDKAGPAGDITPTGVTELRMEGETPEELKLPAKEPQAMDEKDKALRCPDGTGAGPPKEVLPPTEEEERKEAMSSAPLTPAAGAGSKASSTDVASTPDYTSWKDAADSEEFSVPDFFLHPELRRNLSQPLVNRVSFYGVIHDINKEASGMASHDHSAFHRTGGGAQGDKNPEGHGPSAGNAPNPTDEMCCPLVVAVNGPPGSLPVSKPSDSPSQRGGSMAGSAIVDEEVWLLRAIAFRTPAEIAERNANPCGTSFAEAMGESDDADNGGQRQSANPLSALSGSRTQLWKPSRSWWEAKSGKNPWIEPKSHNKRWRYLWPLIHYHKFLARCIKKLKRNGVDVKTSVSPVSVFLREEVCAVSDHLASVSRFTSEQWMSCLAHFGGWADMDPCAEARLRTLVSRQKLRSLGEVDDVRSPLLRDQIDEQFLRAMAAARESMGNGGGMERKDNDGKGVGASATSVKGEVRQQGHPGQPQRPGYPKPISNPPPHPTQFHPHYPIGYNPTAMNPPYHPNSPAALAAAQRAGNRKLKSNPKGRRGKNTYGSWRWEGQHPPLPHPYGMGHPGMLPGMYPPQYGHGEYGMYNTGHGVQYFQHPSHHPQHGGGNQVNYHYQPGAGTFHHDAPSYPVPTPYHAEHVAAWAGHPQGMAGQGVPSYPSSHDGSYYEAFAPGTPGSESPVFPPGTPHRQSSPDMSSYPPEVMEMQHHQHARQGDPLAEGAEYGKQQPPSPSWGRHQDHAMSCLATPLGKHGAATPHRKTITEDPSDKGRKENAGDEEKEGEREGKQSWRRQYHQSAKPLLINPTAQYFHYRQGHVPASPATQFMMSPQANTQHAAYFAQSNYNHHFFGSSPDLPTPPTSQSDPSEELAESAEENCEDGQAPPPPPSVRKVTSGSESPVQT